MKSYSSTAGLGSSTITSQCTGKDGHSPVTEGNSKGSEEDYLGLPLGMVRVISCHHFVSQDVFLAEQEPVALCTAQEKLLVATVQHYVEVRDLDRRGQVFHIFPTVDQVKQLVYCDAANYVATLERKSSRHSNPPITFVRVYLNWWMDMKGQPMRVRIAGQSSPSSTGVVQSSGVSASHLEMVELPLSDLALCIACCKVTGNLAVSLGKTLQIFSFQAKTQEPSGQRFHDFEHLLDIQISFPVLELCICEDYFACLATDDVHVFRIQFEQNSSSSPTQQTTAKDNENRSPVTTDDGDFPEDPHFVEWHFDCFKQDIILDKDYENLLRSKLSSNSFPVDVHMRTIARANASHPIPREAEEILGPVQAGANNPSCPLEISLDSRLEGWNLCKALPITLLYRRFLHCAQQVGLHGLHLMPFYVADDWETELVQADPLSAAAATQSRSLHSQHSPLCSHGNRLKGMGCFFSAIQDGYLYDLMGSQTSLTSHYAYTALVKSVALERDLLHVLTETGLETYTLRLTHKALSHDPKHGVSPNSNDPVCLVGLRPFFGVEQLVMSDRHLVLLSTADDSLSSTNSIEGPSCTIYSLKKPSSKQLFQDLYEVGMLNKVTNSATYLHLISEGHMILRSHLLTRGALQCGQEFLSLYRESCALLADHYACLGDDSNTNIAVQYYVLSELPAEKILNRVRELATQVNQHNPVKCLIGYFNNRLFSPESKQMALVTSMSQSTADSILDIYLEESPDELWKVVLFSSIATFHTDKAMTMLCKRISSKRNCAGDNVAVVSLLLKKENNTEAVQNMLLIISKEDLVSVLVQDHSYLFSTKTFSSLGQIIKQHRPDALVESLLYFIQKRVLTSDDAISLMGFTKEVSPEDVPILREFLESLLTDKKGKPQNHPQCIEILVQIYLNKLKHHVRGNTSRSCLTKACGLFGTRHAWLNELPPFNGHGISRSCSAKHKSSDPSSCTCWHCNEFLLRLQSLLSSDLSASATAQARSFLQSSEASLRGYLSLQVLCSDWSEALSLIASLKPGALVLYAHDMFQSDSTKWCQLYRILQREMERRNSDDPDFKIVSQLTQDVLVQLSDLLTPQEFLCLLPGGTPSSAFSPFVQRCLERHQASLLKEKIIAIGLEVKAIM